MFYNLHRLYYRWRGPVATLGGFTLMGALAFQPVRSLDGLTVLVYLTIGVVAVLIAWSDRQLSYMPICIALAAAIGVAGFSIGVLLVEEVVTWSYIGRQSPGGQFLAVTIHSVFTGLISLTLLRATGYQPPQEL